MLKFHTTYIIPNLHNLLKQFYQIKVSYVVVNVYYMHTGSVSASVSVYSNDNTPGGSRNRKNSKSLDFKLAYQLYAVKID